MAEHGWKHGDVLRHGTLVGLWRSDGRSHGLQWADGSFSPTKDLDLDFTSRLLVIDPEDREQVERLTGALVYAGSGRNDTNHWPEVQQALRAMLAPKPRCSAHGNEECGDCSRIAETNLAAGECCHCESYGKTGMHWDTCQGRIRGLIFGSREAAAAWVGDVS